MVERIRPQLQIKIKRRRITMRRALCDKHLLGASYKGPSWNTWRPFLMALMGEELTSAERTTFTQFTGRDHEPDSPVTEAAFVIGRRGGKDRSAAILAVYIAALLDHSAVLAPGEVGTVLLIAPDQRQARVCLNYIGAAFEASPILAQLVRSRSADSIELTNNIVVEVRSANFRRIRGITALAVIASEASFWYDETGGSANPDTEILAAIRPALATTGGPLIIISSPHARRGELWNIYHRHFGAEGDPDILVVQGKSTDFNPTLSPAVVARAFERDAAKASADYGAEFRTDLESFVSREAVMACVVTGRHELPPASGVRYTAFCDPSGGSSDSMTLGIAHRTQDGASLLDAVRERRPPFSPAEVVAEFAAVAKSYGIRKIIGDHYGGEFVREPFRSHGLTYELADRPKSDYYRDVLPLLNSGKVQLLDHPRMLGQLLNLERKVSRAGRDDISHPPNQHDDIINAAAGCLVLAGAGRRGITQEHLPGINAAIARFGAPDGGNNYATHLGGSGSYGSSMSDLIKSGMI